MPGSQSVDVVRIRGLRSAPAIPIDVLMWSSDPKWTSQPMDLNRFLASVADRAAAEVDAEQAALFLLDAERGELVARLPHAFEVAEIRVRVGEGIAGTAASRRRVMNVPQASRAPEWSRRFDQETGFVTRSLLAVPVLDERGDVLGVLEAVNKRDGDFSIDDEAALTRLAHEVAPVVARTSLRSAPTSFRFNGVVGSSRRMRAALERAARAAPTEATVLIRGESGTGKELIARAIHVNSSRADGPLVKVDCAALPDSLIENELFGHVRGAYTGADRASAGKAAAADGGTLFLDEIGELSGPAQGKLLRLVQERTWYPVGGTQEQTADLRIVAATSRDLEAAVKAGTFRRDLYYRLRVVEVELPALRDRGHAELDRLIDELLASARRTHGRPEVELTREARAEMHAHAWPGNVRELEHCLESAVVLAPGTAIRPSTLPLARLDGPGRGSDTLEVLPLAEMERRYIRRVVDACDGNRSEAARRLRIGRNTLLRKLKAGIN